MEKEKGPDYKKITRRGFLAKSAAVATGTFWIKGAASIAKDGDHLFMSTKTGTGKACDWDALKQKIEGQVVVPSMPSYNDVRLSMVWNELKTDRTPDVIVTVKNEKDVIEAVNFARENKLKIAVHAGGHTWPGLSLRNGGMCIDIQHLNEAKIDKANMTASIQPVISNRDCAQMLSDQGLAFPTGHCSTVKVSGYLLNGGMSWNLAKWGPGCMSVNAIEFVTADGKLITASEKEHSDLFWAARGAGPGMFAVAVRYHLKVYPLPKMYGSAYYFKMSDMHDVAKELGKLAKDLPNFVELTMFILAAKNGQLTEEYTADKGWIFKVTAVAFGDTDKESLAALEQLDSSPATKRALKREAKEPVTFKQLFDGADVAWPSGLRSKVENLAYDRAPEEVLDTIHKDWMDTPSWRSAVTLVISTGKKNFLHSDPNVALSMDGSSYGGLWVMWKDASDDAANLAWTKTAIANLRKVCTKGYIGEIEYVDDNSQVKAAYDPHKWKKLEEIRAKYDAEGLFQGWLGGIPPSA
jgi:FAD/FMN-containing dehydrogenase